MLSHGRACRMQLSFFEARFLPRWMRGVPAKAATRWQLRVPVHRDATDLKPEERCHLVEGHKKPEAGDECLPSTSVGSRRPYWPVCFELAYQNSFQTLLDTNDPIRFQQLIELCT